MNKNSKLRILLLMTTLLFMVGCASFKTKPKVYDAVKLQNIEKWNISFMYEVISVEETNNENGNNETTTKKGGQYIKNLQLLDDMFYHLLDEYDLEISKDSSNERGLIKINPVANIYGIHESIDVTIHDSNDELLARFRFNNDYSISGYLSSEKFAIKSADVIGEYLIQ